MTYTIDINESLSEETLKHIRNLLLAHPQMTSHVTAIVGLVWGDGLRTGMDYALTRLEEHIANANKAADEASAGDEEGA